jgi:hypothetical protein
MNYGGIGVRMCQDWINDFMSFYNWAIVNGWKRGMQIDKDIKARKIGIEWAEIVKIDAKVIRDRVVRYGWSIDKALTTSIGAHKKVKRKK